MGNRVSEAIGIERRRDEIAQAPDAALGRALAKVSALRGRICCH
jgi:hypothetical protein